MHDRVVAALQEQKGRFDRNSVEWNALDRIVQWLKPSDKKKAPLPAPTQASPLRLSVFFAYGGVVSQVEAAEVGEKVVLSDDDPAGKFAGVLVCAGFTCDLHRFKPPPQPYPSRPEIRPTAAPIRAPVIHVLYVAG